MWFLVPSLAVLSGLLLAPGLVIGPSLDAAVFSTVASQVGHGAVLYRDAWDHKPPGIYALLAVGDALLPWLDSWTVSWLLSVLATIITGTAVATMLRRLGVSRMAASAAVALTTIAMAQYLTALGGGLTEPIATAWAAVGIASVVARPAGRLRFAMAGLLLGYATLTSLLLVPAALGIGLTLALTSNRRQAPRLFLYAVGLAVPWTVAAGVLAVTGALGPAVDAIVRYPAAYRVSAGALGGDLSAAPAAWTLLAYLALIVWGVLGALRIRREPGGRALWFGMAFWFATTILLIAYQGRFIAHYAIAIVVPLGLLGGLGVDAAIASGRRRRGSARGPLAAVVLLTATVSLMAMSAGSGFELDANSNRSRQVSATAAYLRDHSESADSLLVWGNRAELYVAADRRPALKFSFMYPLTTSGYASEQLINEVATTMAAHPPLFVVDAGSPSVGEPGFLPLLIDRPLASEGRDLDILEPLRAIIRDHYELVATPAGWPIYRLNAGEAPS